MSEEVKEEVKEGVVEEVTASEVVSDVEEVSSSSETLEVSGDLNP